MTETCVKCKKIISEWEKKRPEIYQVHRTIGTWCCVKCATKLIVKGRKKEGKRK